MFLKTLGRLINFQKIIIDNQQVISQQIYYMLFQILIHPRQELKPKLFMIIAQI